MDTRIANMLDAFVEAHPDGWNHGQWLQLLEDLAAHGLKIADSDEIGVALENRRLARALSAAGVSGLGAKRIDAIVERFGTLWNFRHATADDLAQLKTIPASLAAKVVDAMK